MRTLLFIIITVLSSTLVNGEVTVERISFAGGEHSLKVGLCNKPGHQFQPDSLTADSLKITSYYEQRGWFDCEASYNYKVRDSNAYIDYVIDKKDRYLLSVGIDNLNSAKGFADDISSVIDLINNKPAILYNIERAINDIIEVYADNGYPYCEIRIADYVKNRNSARMEITLHINIGPKVIVEQIKYPGRKNLDYNFIETYTGLIPPVDYNANRAVKAKRRLSLAQFIQSAEDYQLRYLQSPERGVLVIPIKEVSPLIIDGGLGYSANDDNFYGRFNAVISNILGKGRKLEFDWSKKDKSSRWLKAELSEFYPFGVPFRLDLAACQDDRDSLYIESGGDVGLYYIAADSYTFGISMGISRINPESYGRIFIPMKNRKQLAVSISADSRDYPDNPVKGDYFYMRGEFITENTKADDNFAAASINYRTIKLDYEKYIQITKTSTLFGGLTGQGDFSEYVPIDRQFPLGGSNSLRGYNQDFFYVSRFAVGTIEYRLLTSANGRAYIFTDMAVFQIKTVSADIEAWYKAGFGIGLAASVKGGVTTIEIAAPHDESISSAKLHFGFRTGF